MAKFEIVMPKMGESITDATITKWLKKPGDNIAEDEAIAEVATDKVDSEIPSPAEGIIKELLFEEGDTVEVGKPIAVLTVKGEVGNDEPDDKAKQKDKQKESDRKETAETQKTDEGKPDILVLRAKDSSGRFFSPLVRNIAREEGITMNELEQLEGSGKDNRVTKEDILNYLKNRKDGVQTKTAPAKAIQTPKIVLDSGDEVIEMDRMRKLIAEHMIMSEDTSVHITLFAEADVTNLVNWRNKQKGVLQKREGEKLTFTPVFIEVIARALRDFPMVNISVDGTKIIKRKNINIGMAAALPNGNLIVPVIKNADHKSLLGLTKEVNDLANRSRTNQLKPDEIQGGTFTLTNFGTFGAISGTPIINQPQVAILGVGIIAKKPVVIETPDGDTIGIRSRMMLSLSCDHRVVDGALGSMFLKRVVDYLEGWDTSQVI